MGKPIWHSDETYDKIRFLAKVKNQTQTAVVKELIDVAFQLGSLYPHGLNFEYEVSMLDASITIRAKGKSSMQIGIATEEELQKKKDEKMKEAKEAIEKAKKKLELKGEK